MRVADQVVGEKAGAVPGVAMSTGVRILDGGGDVQLKGFRENEGPSGVEGPI